MNCKIYKEKYIVFTKFPLGREVYDSDEYEYWVEHSYECEACGDWDLEQKVIKRGHDISNFPCPHIAYHSTNTCNKHKDAWECPDMTIVKTSDGYGIPIRDGGSSFIEISNCPWCGVKL